MPEKELTTGSTLSGVQKRLESMDTERRNGQLRYAFYEERNVLVVRTSSEPVAMQDKTLSSSSINCAYCLLQATALSYKRNCVYRNNTANKP